MLHKGVTFGGLSFW